MYVRAQNLCEIGGHGVVLFKDFQNGAKNAPVYVENTKSVPVLEAFPK